MSVASDYLKLRQERQNQTMLDLMERKRDEQKIMTGSYYQMPQLEPVQKSATETVKRLENSLTQRKQALSTKEAAMKDEQELLSFLQHRAESLGKSYQVAPSQATAAQYEKACADYAQAQQKARNNYLDYLAAYDAYDAEYQNYSEAATLYQEQMARIQEQMQAWRSSIRGADAVQQDLDAVDALIDSLQKRERQELPVLGQALDWAGLLNREKSGEMKALEAKRDLLQEEYDWSRYYQYADLMGAEDFADKSKYVPTAKEQERSNLDIMLGNYSADKSAWDDPLYEYINGNKEAGAYISNQAAAGYGADNVLGAIFGRAAESQTQSQQMTEDEVAIFNYLYATQGKEAAHAYYDYLQADLNYRQRQESEAYWKQFAQENPLGASVFSLATSPLKGLSYVGQAGDLLEDGKLDKDAAYNQFSYVHGAIRNEVAQKIEESGKWGKVGSFAYQTGMSMGDFLLNTALSGGNQALALTIMGSGAAADATLAAKDRGLSDGQAFALGTVAGLAEAATEKFSLEALLDASALGKGAAGYIAKNMLAEGSEEGASSLINLFADILISKDKSQWSQSIAAFKAQGMDDGQAFGRAFADQAASIGLDVLGGALSGGILAGGGAAINGAGNAVNRLQQAQQAKKEQAAGAATFQEEIQKQVTENMVGKNGAQKGAARLGDMQVQIDDATFQQGQRLAQALGRDVVFYTADGNENGYYENGVIYINTKGHDPMLQVFSHELTHGIEGASGYGELSRLVLQRMEQSGVDLETARQAKRDLYARNGKKLESAAAVDQELVAEYVSKYLLTDERSITDLVRQNRSLGQRIAGWFDKVLSLFGNQNAQERAFLSRARDLYAKALQQTQGSFTTENAGTEAPMGERAGQETEFETQAQDQVNAVDELDWENDPIGSLDAMYANGDLSDAAYDDMREVFEQYLAEQATASERQYSISRTVDNKPFVIVEQDILAGVPQNEWVKTVKDNLKQKFPNGITLGRNSIQIDSQSRKELTYSSYTKWLRHNDPQAYGDKFRATDNANEILNATTDWVNEGLNHPRNDKIKDFARGKVLLPVGGNDYAAEVIVGTDAKGMMRLYDILNLQLTQIKEKEKVAATAANPSPGADRNTATFSRQNISQNQTGVNNEGNQKYSISEDAVRKKDVASDLRAILKRGGSTAELRQYVAKLERSGGKPEQKVASAEQTGGEAEQILKNARRQGIGVEEYLRQNWEQYDQDGQWNADARKALEMEKQAGRKYSISDADIQKMQSIGRKSVNEFTSADIKATEQFAKQYWKEMGIKSPFFRAWFGDWRANDQTPVQIADQQGDTRGVQKNTDTGWDIQVSGKVFNETSAHQQAQNLAARTYLPYINDIVKKAVLLDSYALGTGKAKSNNSLLMHSLYAVADSGNGPELLKLYVEEMNDPNSADTRKRAYQLQNIESQQLSAKGSGSSLAQSISTADIESVADLFAAVKQHDANFNPNPASKIVNDDGSPKVMHHGTKAENGEFYEFDATKAVKKGGLGLRAMGQGNYFTAKKLDGTERYGSRVIPAYLDMKNPFVYNGGSSFQEQVTSKLGLDPHIDTAMLQKQMKSHGYDGVVQYNSNGDVSIAVTFSSNQIKSATENIGTFDGSNADIRYSISEDGEAVQQAEDGHEEDIRGTMPRKAQEYLKRAERNLLWKIGDALSVPKLARREYLVPIIQELSDEYLRSGTIAQEKLDLLFEKAYAEGVIVDAEFYNQYKDIKDHLRNVRVTISERDQADIADFKLFKKRAFGTLKIVNEGGLPVDSAYQELQEMAPELFPESITHPADQLVRMFDAARSIQLTEKTVHDYYGEYEPEYRRWVKADFETAVGEVLGELQTVKRYADERKAKENQKAPATAAEAMEAYKELKAARRAYERAAAKNLLTAHDEMQVGRLLKHEIELEHLDPQKDNVKGITAVYEAKAEYDRLCKLIGEYKQHLRGQQRKLADKYLETANSWKDKKVGVLYSRETMRRNILDIVPDAKLAKAINEEFFEPVHRSEAQSNRFRTRYRDRVRTLELSTKVDNGNLVSEAHAVQLLGEAEDNIRMLENMRGRIKNRDGKNISEWQAVIDKLWAENPNLDKGKIQNAVKTFRKIYDELFQQMNEVRVANGYEPVNYRNGYFPHFQPGDSDSILAQFGKMLGIDTQVVALPTTINGLTHTFKPGIQWFGNAQERLGFNTAYDAVEGFDKYIEGVASVIYHTENIQKLRALATQIRYRTSEKGIQEQVDAIYADNRYSEEEKQVMINEIYAHGKFALSNFVTELDEYTNLLANKKSKYDRSIEAMMGRRVYTFMKAWEARVGANMIAGNLTSALTNFIPLTQAGAQMDRFSLLKGMWGTLQAYREDDGMVGMSSFLTNRRGSDPLIKTWAQKASGVLGTPMELIDNFTADSIVRGAYYQNLKRGLSEAEAMNQADIFASNVMADRSKGAMPTMLQASNPLFKAFTQFQLEVNNQFSEVFKDLPRGFKEKGLKALAWVLLKYFLGALIYNELYEKLIGRRPALDPIGILCDAVKDTRDLGIGQAGANFAVNLLEQLPFTAGLNLIGIEIDGGRIPASAAVPDLSAIWDAATTEGWSAKKRWKEVQDELSKLAYVVPPFGGNQAMKLWKGVKAYIQGGSYSVDAAGNDILQYPVYKDSAGDAFWSLVKAAFLGKSSLGTAQDWVDNGFDSLGANQTAVYQDMLAAGVKDRDAFALLQEIQSAQETDAKKKDAVQRDILRDSEVSGEGKSIIYYGLMATDKEREVMDSLDDMGADAYAVTKALMEMRDANSLKGSAATNAKYEAIRKAALTDEEKTVLVGSMMGTELLTDTGGITQYAKFQYAVGNGMSVDQFIEYRSTGASIDDYLELRDVGASIEDAMEVGIALQELRNSVEDPSSVQKWRTVIDSTNDVQTQLISLSIVMTDSQYRKVLTAYNFGISPEAYVRINESLAKYDEDRNGRYTQAEVTKAINAMTAKPSVKAALWQLVTGSSSAKNNPYSAEVGQKVIDALAAAKEKDSEVGLSFEEEIRRQLMGG